MNAIVTPVALDRSKRSLKLQFSFSKWNTELEFLPQRNDETWEEKSRRKGCLSEGILFLPPTERVDISPLVSFLKEAELVLIEAFWKRRIGGGTSSMDAQRYYMVEFSFSFRPNDNYVQTNCHEYFPVLERLAAKSFWRARGFINAFRENNAMVKNQYAVCIPLHLPVHRFRGDGSPVTIWEKDSQGKKIGGKPSFIKAKCSLGIINNRICTY